MHLVQCSLYNEHFALLAASVAAVNSGIVSCTVEEFSYVCKSGLCMCMRSYNILEFSDFSAH